MSPQPLAHHSRLPHRLAVALVCVVFPLIWVGGLVTTYDAGMAVPDWPSTYGYNLFLYPWSTWLFGPWDLFIEHGHRLLGATAGLVTIALALSIFVGDRRRWMSWVAVVAVVGVVVQGVLGGLRVLENSDRLALVHGCLGPAFFAFCAAIVVMTSGGWRDADRGTVGAGAGRLHRLAVTTALLAYVQLVVGAMLRHMPVQASREAFRTVVFFHLLFAALLVVYVALLAVRIARRYRQRGLSLPAAVLAALVVFQLLLGAGSWVVKYSWPDWMSWLPISAAYTVRAESMWQAVIVTAHVANGSLVLAVAVVIALRALRFVRGTSHESQPALLAAGLVA